MTYRMTRNFTSQLYLPLLEQY